MKHYFCGTKSKERVSLGVGGGMDSSVTAMRLQDAGYKVTGTTFRFYGVDGRAEYLDDAHTLAVGLDIEHATYDIRELLRERIIRYFIDGHLAGYTPVPYTLCNNELKQALLARTADEKGICWIFTGHYARKILLGEQCYIVPASDRDKDRTSFLWGLKQGILQRTLLPIRGVTREEARAYAAGRGFVRIVSRKDSTGVCLCPLDYRSFLKCEVPAERLSGEGLFIGEKGEILGSHEGHSFYAIGQRHGLGIHFDCAVFVKEARTATNEMVSTSLVSLYKDGMLLKGWNLVSEQRVLSMETIIVEIRYCRQVNHCRVALTVDRCLRVSLLESLEAVAPGQAIALYDADGLLSGGSTIL